MPDFSNKPKYKPTVSKIKTKESDDKDNLSSVVTFQVTADGFIKNVVASGENAEFNRDLEITLYKLAKWTPRCNKGFAKTESYKLPVKMNFK